MDYLRFELSFWCLAGILVLINSVALTLFIYKRRIRSKASREKVWNPSRAAALSDKSKMNAEIERLRDGGSISQEYLRRMTAEEKALFEVQLIDALTKWPREDQHQLRSSLIKHGYDEHCARRLMRESVSDSVRASTLLSLLRPQSQAKTGDLAQRPKSDTGKLSCSASGEGQS